MRMNEGVEWALHCCLNLAWAGPEEAVTAARLAAFYELPTAYLNKQLQALAREGIVSSTPGPRGGFRLARLPEEITVLDVVTAIEGRDPAFQCTDIRKRTPGHGRMLGDDFRQPCLVHQTMSRADLAWRRELAGQTLADLKASIEAVAPQAPDRTRGWLLEARA
ncbi:RrF2 family transcriptional regulator [Streptomyces sp. NPDC002574]|uniref:RrF2 family transcriptional regulator n=1 Tax=Streptomyces sp. NPDC002574 TaxID=3364652 RepID=UPI0036A66890